MHDQFDEDLIKDHSPTSLAFRYAREWCWWALSGFQYRSQEEIDENHEVCKLCIYYEYQNEENGECGICGCPLNKEKKRANKIAYVSTKCPHPEPMWTANAWWNKIWRWLTNTE